MWTSLVGFMGSGKSSVARSLCRVTGRPLAACDELAADRAGRSIARVFSEEGETYFRDLEGEVLAELDPARPLVVDTGGGVVESPKLVAILRERGVVIWLDAPWQILRERLRSGANAEERPLVASLGWSAMERLHRRRRRLYAAASDFRLRAVGGDVEDLARMVSLRSLLWARRREERVW